MDSTISNASIARVFVSVSSPKIKISVNLFYRVRRNGVHPPRALTTRGQLDLPLNSAGRVSPLHSLAPLLRLLAVDYARRRHHAIAAALLALV